jgi:nitrate/nitrite transporter NarK
MQVVMEYDAGRTATIDKYSLQLSKWQALWLLALAEFLAMTVWFSASAVVPSLTSLWNLSASGQSWLTMSVQVGFVVGAFGSAVFNLADRFPSRYLFSASAFAHDHQLITVVSP